MRRLAKFWRGVLTRVVISESVIPCMCGYRIDEQLTSLGEHVRGWRMVLGLTAQQVFERAGITRDTLRKVKAGDLGVSFGNVAGIRRA